jgi:glycosyltransferase involved in cell wall biosynthesis
LIGEISIIIPTLNEEEYLPELLESIQAQTFPGKLEVVVVDGNSTDKTVEVARKFKSSIPELKIIEAKPDIGNQRNIGASHAKYKYLLFLDADVILTPGVLEKLAKKVKFKTPFVLTIAHTAQDMNLADKLLVASGYLMWFQSQVLRVPVTPGDFLLTTRENHLKVKGFVEGALLGEDVDYGLRSVKSGAKHRFYLTPKVIGSLRRAHTMGRVQMLRVWSRGYQHVLRSGPVFPDEGFEYEFGKHVRSKKPR